MTVLLAIGLILAIIIGFLLFLALITPKAYTIEREIVIDKPSENVFDYVKLVKNQEQFNVWVMKDPNVQITYKGVDGTPGFVSAWEGNKQAGKGEQEIKEINQGKSIHLELRFEKPFKNIGQTYFIISQIGASKSNLKWKMVGINSFPMNLMNLFIDNLLGKDLAKSLANVKKKLENNNR